LHQLWLPVGGGSIKNVTLKAAFLAAADGGMIRQAHLLPAGSSARDR
jgi:hypothetical protein